MNDDATGATTTTASAASAASAAAPDITDAAASPAAARPQATVKPETVKLEAVKPPEKPEADPLFFSRLLRTQRLMEKDARAAKISSLSIV